MNRKRALLFSAVLIAVLLAIAVTRIDCQDDGRSSSGHATTRRSAPLPDLRIGVYLSRRTADQIDGYSAQMTAQLQHRNLELIPLLEPGGESDPRVVKILDTYFPGKTALDVNNAESLKNLDVIVAPRIWYLPDEARAAIEQTVTNGAGLFIRDGLGCMEPGDDPDTSRLCGFEHSTFGYNPHPMECEVIASHPILGKLKLNQVISITPNGTWGKPLGQTIPLVRVKDMDAFRDFEHRGQDDWTFYPVYISQLGKGRIIGCQFPAWEPMPKSLMSATDNEFNLRCVQWLAHRLDGAETSSPATRLATSSPTSRP